jgi:hypothetical protein
VVRWGCRTSRRPVSNKDPGRGCGTLRRIHNGGLKRDARASLVLTLSLVGLAAGASAQPVPACVSSAGVPAGGGCNQPRISASGRFVAFPSRARNLVADDVADFSDGIYPRDVLIAKHRIDRRRARLSPPGEGFAGTQVEVVLPSNSRTTVPIYPTGVTARFRVLVESIGASPVPIVVEGAFYWTIHGVVSAAGSNLVATPIP